MSPSELKAYEGHYRMGPGSYLQLKLKDNNLVVDFAGNIFRLSPVSETEFIIVEFGMPVHITKDADGKIDGFLFQGMKSPKVDLVEINKEQLKAYKGRYVNEDLDTYYDIVMHGDKLVLTSLRGRDIRLTPENPKSFAGSSQVMPFIAFKIDDAKNIVGFCVDTDTLRSFFFKKITK